MGTLSSPSYASGSVSPSLGDVGVITAVEHLGGLGGGGDGGRAAAAANLERAARGGAVALEELLHLALGGCGHALLAKLGER